MEEKKLQRLRIIIIVGILIAVLFSVIHDGMSGDYNEGGKYSNSRVCGSCGRTFSSKSDFSDYKSIVKTGMCENCYSSYESLKWALGK